VGEPAQAIARPKVLPAAGRLADRYWTRLSPGAIELG
jgi:hypothetical protein